MYIPGAFRFDDYSEKIAFIKQHSFAPIVTNINNIPVATMLPFAVECFEGRLLLRSHFALANEQAAYVENNTSLVIFSGPHAYISPKHYYKKESVPTWDYITVHAYGKATILHDEESKKQLLRHTIDFFDPEYHKQWSSLSGKYIDGMLRAIVAFEFEVTLLRGQKKLSQNKTLTERENIVRHLELSDNSTEKELAAHIKSLS